MGQGLKNAPMIYQRMITNALYGFVDLPPGMNEVDEDGEPRDMFQIGHVRDASSMPAPANRPSFVDDISDGADSWTGVVDLTDRILQRLTYFNISITALKSKFGKTVVDFLGHLISREGIHAKPRGLHQVLQMPFPKSLRAMQSFLGSINLYSRFIENYSIKASCLYEISDDQLRQGSVSSAALAAFDELKRAYASTPVLKHANTSLPRAALRHELGYIGHPMSRT
ncbi:hypothetical protein AeMF1_006876 [Aphanomyces euteiches]|nr:hypothetical protein AeMF1_006876 [Aphanomyces euteiches]